MNAAAAESRGGGKERGKVAKIAIKIAKGSEFSGVGEWAKYSCEQYPSVFMKHEQALLPHMKEIMSAKHISCFGIVFK